MSIGEGRGLDKRNHYSDNSDMDVGIYTTPKYTAYIYPTNIVICTRHQAFRVTYDRYNMNARLDGMKSAIINNQLDDVSDILHMSNRILRINACNKPSILS